MKRAKIPSEALTAVELDALLTAARPDPRLYLMILLAVNHGLRAEELCRLRSGDFTGDYLLIRHFKTKEVDQHPLTPEESSSIRGLLANPVALAVWSRGPTFFGVPYSTFYRRFRALAETLGLPQSKSSPHCLRHTCIKRAIARGVPIPAVQRFVRHRSLSATARYTKFTTLEACDLILGEVK